MEAEKQSRLLAVIQPVHWKRSGKVRREKNLDEANRHLNNMYFWALGRVCFHWILRLVLPSAQGGLWYEE